MAEGFTEDALSIPTPAGAGRVDNKFEGTENPDDGTVAQINVTLAENDFPRQTGHDSLSSEEALLT